MYIYLLKNIYIMNIYLFIYIINICIQNIYKYIYIIKNIITTNRGDEKKTKVKTRWDLPGYNGILLLLTPLEPRALILIYIYISNIALLIGDLKLHIGNVFFNFLFLLIAVFFIFSGCLPFQRLFICLFIRLD